MEKIFVFQKNNDLMIKSSSDYFILREKIDIRLMLVKALRQSLCLS